MTIRGTLGGITILTVVSALFGCLTAMAQPETGMTGKWVTDAVSMVKRDRRGNPSREELWQFPTQQLWQVPAAQSPARAEPAVAMVLRDDQAGRLNGSVTLVESGTTYNVEDTVMTGKSITFTVRLKSKNGDVPTLWRGVLADSNTMTITVTRLTTAAEPPSDIAPLTLTCHRSK